MRRLTVYERNRLAWLNIAALSCLLHPAKLTLRRTTNFVHPLLSTPKPWRDVYHYDARGNLTGWTRHQSGQRHPFTPAGRLIEKRDPAGRPVVVREVHYTIERDPKRRLPRELTWKAIGEPIRLDPGGGAATRPAKSR